MNQDHLNHLNNHAIFQTFDLLRLWKLKDELVENYDLMIKALAYVAETSNGKFAENCREAHTKLLDFERGE